MIVDDKIGMELAVQRALQDYSVHLPEMALDIIFTVTHAQTGEAALQEIQTAPPDILLLDHKLPGISGLEILSWLSAAPYDLLTVMITAYASLENAVLATKRGSFDFLAKPFTPAELRSVVHKTARHLLLQRQARRFAEEKRQVRFEFISIMAHELKAPLAAVEQYLAILAEMLTTEAEKQILTRSTLRIQGMRKMILDLLDLTGIETGRRRRRLEPIDPGKIVTEAVEVLRPLAQAKGLTVAMSQQGRTAFCGDRWELTTMITNLLSNAIKYNRDNGRVDIAIAMDPSTVQIRFQDTGIGLSAAEAGGLFREFARVRTEATEHVPGSGLGLAIVKKIAGLYHGDVEIVSTPGRGSTFTLILGRA